MDAAPSRRDYSLIGRDAKLAVETGLAAAEWYHTDIPRKQMKELMQRSDGPA
ncbi:MAG: fatty acid desaturase, partial [Mesorhizobium sp.]